MGAKHALKSHYSDMTYDQAHSTTRLGGLTCHGSTQIKLGGIDGWCNYMIYSNGHCQGS